jgi:two-component system, sensor histidine kinase
MFVKKDILDQLNLSALELLNANTTKKLESSIVESVKKISDAVFGQLYVYEKDRLKKVYSSDAEIKKCNIVKQSQFRKLVLKGTITHITPTKMHEWAIENLPQSVQSINIVPLNQKDTPLGFILLYMSKQEDLSDLEKKALTIFSQSAVMAVSKARLQEESKKALEIRDRFISLASHELRTPLTSLHGYIQLLHAKMVGKDTVEARWVNELHVESIRLTTLVKELLDVNRIKQGQFAFVFSEVPIHEVVNRAIDHHKLTSSDHPVVFYNKMEEETNVIGDYDKLVEMVSGLISNAIKFSKPQEKITVTLKTTQGALSLIVRDTGKGISKKDLAAVFDGFYKSSHASHLEGMGVGLLLAKHIVDNHRGKIKITSKENKGTKVEVILPTIKAVPI